MHIVVAAARNPQDYLWYKITAKTKTVIDTPKYEIEFGTGDKFGLKTLRNKTFLVDGDDLSMQHAITEADVKKLMRRSAGFRGKINKVTVKPGETKASKAQKVPEDKAIPKSTGVKRRAPSKPSSKPSAVTPRPQRRTEEEFEEEVDGLPPIPTAKARIKKRRAWLQPEKEAEEPRNELPTPKPEVKAPAIRIPKAPTTPVRDPDIATGKAVARLVLALRNKKSAMSYKARNVVEWLEAESATKLTDLFAVRYINRRSWPTEEQIEEFLQEIRKFPDRPIINAMSKLDASKILSRATYVYGKSAVLANELATERKVDAQLVRYGFGTDRKFTRDPNLTASVNIEDMKLVFYYDSKEVHSTDIPKGRLDKIVANAIEAALQNIPE